ncbi:MAG: hypothetical protein U9N83_16650 [Thermodesulfobacteriota bacterium]|nr:hypothetical protein [Thermodesulfobacteriota bacterium]
MSEAIQQLGSFIGNWTETQEQNKKAFVRLKDYIASKPGVNLDFISREGLTYSLRAAHKNQKNKPLFVMVDVIEDTPRWLSVCFYNEMITDPDENGDFVPDGLLGEDALCFDLEEYNEEGIRYVEARMDEAYKSAA